MSCVGMPKTLKSFRICKTFTMMVPLHVRHRQTDGVTQHDAQNSKVCVIVEYNWTGFFEKRNTAEKKTLENYFRNRRRQTAIRQPVLDSEQ